MKDALWLIAGMTAVTFLTRASFLVFARTLRFPPAVRRALRYVPVAVLPALVVPMALLPGGAWSPTPANPYLVGTVVAAAVAIRTKKTLLAIVLSFVVYLVWRLLFA
ncbi:branched-subunit amino acid transport protein [Crenobacter luteus]|uniref:AzlD domain-containing protein n=1 Tax=Crenobacter luteus TaxID=1452487 RepID=UPI00104FA718|nr:AzlD domain-containing protein [Crenobacter luteus]TCP15122.1 branched-subunit amino acid transport protein [Crenobacter luteus]